jgi:hypothetical protein
MNVILVVSVVFSFASLPIQHIVGPRYLVLVFVALLGRYDWAADIPDSFNATSYTLDNVRVIDRLD